MNLVLATKDKYSQIKKLYNEAFPYEERKPFSMIERSAKKGNGEILINEGENVSCMLTTALYKDLVLIDYFAVDSSLRGKGIGSRAIAECTTRYKGKRIFLEIELPNGKSDDEIKLRRKDFYLRNGFSQTGITANVFGIPMELLSFNCTISFEEYREVYRKNFGLISFINIKQL